MCHRVALRPELLQILSQAECVRVVGSDPGASGHRADTELWPECDRVLGSKSPVPGHHVPALLASGAYGHDTHPAQLVTSTTPVHT